MCRAVFGIMESSGADKGFFQDPPVLGNQFYDDATYQRCFKRKSKRIGRHAYFIITLTTWFSIPAGRYRVESRARSGHARQ